ncbi:MAG: hypothetical protein ACFFDK_19440 [Promethearchaeota archaeon]
MKNDNQNFINEILSLLNQFIDGKIVKLERCSREHPVIFHYYIEIVRYWNKLNFILQKTLRSLDIHNPLRNEMSRYIYTTYRKIQENATKKNILSELDLPHDQYIQISRFIEKLDSFSWKYALIGKTNLEVLSIKEAIPTFFIEHLLPVMSFNFMKENIQSMNDHHKYDNFIRISDLKLKLSNQKFLNILKKELKSQNIPMKRDPEIPELIFIPNDKKSLVLKCNSYLSNKIIFQDKASVAILKVLFPQPSEYICDMCAAPGNKTNLIAKYTSNQARVIAGEFLTKRAYKMSYLISRTDILNIHIINCDSIQFPLRYKDSFDRVLLDAPCTGSGTFATNPELKWRQNKNFLHQNITLQEKLIESALSLLKPNGIFVYSTCSLYPEEGELQILKFINQLEALELPVWFSSSYKIDGNIIPGTGRTFPLSHHTHGFFVGKFKKK